MYLNGENVTYLDGFRVENITKEIKKIRRQQNSHNKYLQGLDPFGFINFILKGKGSLVYTNLLPPN